MQSNFYHSKETVDQYIEMAKDVNSSGLIEKYKKYLPEGSTILEIGSGPGTDWENLNQTFNTIGSDYSEEFCSRLQSKFPDGEFLLLDAVSLETNEVFAGIYSNKVLIHLNDEELEKSLERQAQVLNKNGIISHSFWKGEGTEIYNTLFVNYQTASTLERLFSKHFDIILLEEYKEFEDNDSIVVIAELRD